MTDLQAEQVINAVYYICVGIVCSVVLLAQALVVCGASLLFFP